jgi:hypothetical protein
VRHFEENLFISLIRCALFSFSELSAMTEYAYAIQVCDESHFGRLQFIRIFAQNG